MQTREIEITHADGVIRTTTDLLGHFLTIGALRGTITVRTVKEEPKKEEKKGFTPWPD